MNCQVCLFASLCCSLFLVESARILAFLPFPSKSHHRVITPLLRELTLRGHQVTFYTPILLEDAHENLHQIHMANYLEETKSKKRIGNWKELYSRTKGLLLPLYMIVFKFVGLHFTEWLLMQKKVQELLTSDEKYDAVIMETIMFQETFITLGHKFNAPVIEFVAAANIHWHYWLHGTPFDASYIGDFSLDCSDKMTFSQRLTNTLVSCVQRLVFSFYFTPKHQAIMDEKVKYQGWEDRPSMIDMVSNISLVLLNSHISVNYPYALAPHIKEIAGLNIAPNKPLPQALQHFLDDANDGVIYFAMGSAIGVSNILGDEERDTFVKVFSELKLKVLWKWEKEFPNLPPNVMISKWFPQQDILGHKNVKLFITHGGLVSLTESIYHGVPTLGIPIVGDEYRYVTIMTDTFKCSYSLSFDNVTYDSLKYAINEVLNNPMYKKNMMKRSQMLRDRPHTALETAVYWTEYVIRHKGAPHLRPAIATMPWYQQAMLDVYSAMAVIMLIPLYITYKVILRLTRKFSRKCQGKDSGKKRKKE